MTVVSLHSKDSCRRWLGLAAFGFYVGMIYLANALTVRFGLVSVGFGLVATAGTYTAGWAFVGRNLVQEVLGRRLVVAAILLGAGVTWLLTSRTLALASGTAFLLSETADFLVYTPIRERGKASRSWAVAAVAGNGCGAVIDTFVFLSLAGFPVLALTPGQLVGKAYATIVYLGIGWLVRRLVVAQ